MHTNNVPQLTVLVVPVIPNLNSNANVIPNPNPNSNANVIPNPNPNSNANVIPNPNHNSISNTNPAKDKKPMSFCKERNGI